MVEKNVLLVSVIVPVYNVEKHITKCINSILNQSYENLELLLIDDGSTDNSGQICDEFAEKDMRISVQHIKNGGVSNARNTGLELATGEYVMFVDSDDWVSPDYVHNLLPINDEDMVHSGYWTVVNGKSISKHPPLKHTVEFAQWVQNFAYYWAQGPLLPPWGICFKRSIIEKHKLRFDTEIDISEDELFNLVYLRYCNKVRYTEECDYYYKVEVDGSLMHRHHPCRTLSMMKTAQATEQLTQQKEYHIRWTKWHTALEHHRKYLKISVRKYKKNIRRYLTECYAMPYFRECISYIRKKGSRDERFETYFMNYYMHFLYKPMYKVIQMLSEIKNITKHKEKL